MQVLLLDMIISYHEVLGSFNIFTKSIISQIFSHVFIFSVSPYDSALLTHT